MCAKDDVIVDLKNRLSATTNLWDRISLLLKLSIDYGGNQPQQALQYSKEALQLAKRFNDGYWLAQAHYAIGLNTDKAEQRARLFHFQEAAHRFEKLGDVFLCVQAQFYVGNVFFSMQRYADAIPIITECLHFFKSKGDSVWILRAYESFGSIYISLGSHHKALRCLRKAELIAKRFSLDKEKGSVYNQLGRLYGVLEDRVREERYLLKALRINRKVGNKSAESTSLTALSTLYGNTRKRDRLIYCVVHARKLIKELGGPAHEDAMELQKLSLVYKWDGNHRKALRMKLKALRILCKCEDLLYPLCGHINVAEQYLSVGDNHNALKYALKAVELSKLVHDVLFKCYAYEISYEIYEKLGQSDNALKFYKLASAAKEQTYGSTKQREAVREEARFALKKAKKKMQSQEKKLLELTTDKEEKEQELVSLALELTQKNERLSRLESANNGDKNGHASLTEADTWDAFSRQFHKVHHNFYYSLARKHTKLTVTEMKVCSLIRIGLSSQEIADFLCVSKRTVDTHREHIRTKLNLPARAQLMRTIQAM